MGLSEESFHLDATGDLDKISEREKQKVSDDLVGFMSQFKSKFNEAHLKLQVKEHDETFRGQRQMYCKLHLTTDRGHYHSSETGWGVVNALHNALDELEGQIRKKFGKMETRISIRDKAVEEVME